MSRSGKFDVLGWLVIIGDCVDINFHPVFFFLLALFLLRRWLWVVVVIVMTHGFIQPAKMLDTLVVCVY